MLDAEVLFWMLYYGGCWMLDSECWMLNCADADAECWMLNAEC